MTENTILLVGAGGHARACIDVLEAGGWNIVGLLGLPAEVGISVLGYSIVGTDQDLKLFRNRVQAVLIAIGQIESVTPRITAFEQARSVGFELPVVISRHAYVSKHATIGEGTIIMHGAVVNAGAQVGSNCIVNSNALIEHDAEVGNHCHISTRSVINGATRVGDRCFIGSGSVSRNGVEIGDDCFIAMGCNVWKKVAAGSRVLGGING